MEVTKRNTKKEEKETTTKTSTEKKVEAPACKSGCGCCCNGLKFLFTVVLTALIVVCGFVFYLKQFQPDVYSKKIDVLINKPNTNRAIVNEQITTSVTEQVTEPVTEPVTEQVTEAVAEEENQGTNAGYDAKKHSTYQDIQNRLEDEINLDEYDGIINLEEKAFLKDCLKEERIYERLKNRPDLLKVKEYMDEPIGQLVKRFSLEQQIVLFIDSNDERSKITRLAISRAKVPFGIMEVDAEPRRNSIKEALFRMTAQRTFPYIFVNGKFFGNSYGLKNAMQNGSFYELIDNEENKANWLLDKEDYAKVIEKRKKDNAARKQKKLDKIRKKIEDYKKNAEL